MAATIGTRIARAVAKGLQQRDRAEMRAVNTVLSLIESPRPKPRRAVASWRTAPTGRPRARTAGRSKPAR